MVDDATMFLSLLVMLVQDEDLEQTSTDVNVFQRPHEKKIKKVVCTQVVQLMWDCCVSLNLHIPANSLKLNLALTTKLERFDECQCEDDDGHLFYRTWVFSYGDYCWLKGPITLLLME